MSKYLPIFLISLAFFSLQIMNRPFFTKGESREALVIQDMFAQNNFILPMRNGDQIPSKPPMFHWSSAFFSKILGLSEFAIRAPSALYASLTFIVTLIFTKSLSASLIMASSLEFNRSATSARVDMCFCFFLTLATFLIFHIINSKEKSILTYLALSLGFVGSILSKGPAGLAFPATITAIYGLKIFRFKELIKQKTFYLILGSTILALLLSAIWYYQAYLIGGDDFLSVHIGRENVGRFVNNDTDPGHIKPFYFSFIYLLVGFLPWSLILPFSLFKAYKNKKLITEDKLFIFSLIWLAVYFSVVTLAMSKRVVYLMPAYPACAYIISKTFNNSIWSTKISRTCNIMMGGVTILVVLLVAFESQASKLALSLGIKGHDLYIGTLCLDLLKQSPIILIAGVSTFLLLLFSKSITTPNKTAYALGLLCLVTNAAILPEISASLSPKNFAQMFTKDAQIAFYKEAYYAFSYYSGKNLKVISTVEESKNINYVIVSDEKLKEFKSIFGEMKPTMTSNTPIIYGKFHAYLFLLNPQNTNSNRRIL